MEEKEFTGINIPSDITDPEVIEYFRLINEVFKKAFDKKLPILLLAELDSSNGITSAMGCPHCISKCITRFLDSHPKAMDIMMNGLVEHMINKHKESNPLSVIEQLVRDAKKNTAAGN